jgi:hypothetical protein
MPTETIVVVIGIVLVFVVFMLALAWADAQTRKLQKPPLAE